MSTRPHAPSPRPPDDSAHQLGGELPHPTEPADEQDLLWKEYEAHFRWYDRAATRSRRAYAALKVASLTVAAAVPVVAALRAPAGVTATLAAVVVVVEGILQMFQLQTNWISYRATAEALRQQAFLYAAQVDPYNDPGTRRDRLATFLSSTTGRENTTWAQGMRQTSSKVR